MLLTPQNFFLRKFRRTGIQLAFTKSLYNATLNLPLVPFPWKLIQPLEVEENLKTLTFLQQNSVTAGSICRIGKTAKSRKLEHSRNMYFYCILSYPILSYPILIPSYPILSYCIVSCYILSYPIGAYSIVSCFVIQVQERKSSSNVHTS